MDAIPDCWYGSRPPKGDTYKYAAIVQEKKVFRDYIANGNGHLEHTKTYKKLLKFVSKEHMEDWVLTHKNIDYQLIRYEHMVIKKTIDFIVEVEKYE